MLADQAAVFVDPVLAAASRVLMMGNGADLIATLNGVSRAEADAVALASQQRATAARANGWFRSIVPIADPETGKTASEDECIRVDTTLEKLARMQPAFSATDADAMQLAANPQLAEIAHVHTAGNSPAMADAAALFLLGDAASGERLGLRPRALLRAATTACDDPLQVVGGCIAATAKLLRGQGMTSHDVDLFELHEAFAATVIRAQRELVIEDGRLNPLGGVIALGHPLGATGAIMAGTLLDELERRGGELGVVAASGAAGSGTALLLQRVVA
jgi:acetyl-CoA C-acetyltransferase